MNWNEEWNNSIRLTSRERLNCGAFWDERARPERKAFFDEAMTADQMEIIRPASSHDIIEIGPGNGRLTIPMAKASRRVLAIDPSGDMLNVLREKATNERLGNIQVLNRYWEGYEIPAGKKADKLVSSYSLFMLNVEEQLKRMGQAAEEVYLFLPGELRIPFSVQEIMFGSPQVRHTDREIIHNIASELGYDSRTSTLEYPGMSFDSETSLMDYYCDMYGANGAIKQDVCEHLQTSIRESDGRFVTGLPLKVGVVQWR